MREIACERIKRAVLLGSVGAAMLVPATAAQASSTSHASAPSSGTRVVQGSHGSHTSPSGSGGLNIGHRIG